MNDFLNADSVTEALFDKGIFARKTWKLNRVTSKDYDVIFEFANSARIAGFTIYIKKTRHCIGLTALINWSRQFHIPIDDVMVKCAIED
jgi:hypothetical protein